MLLKASKTISLLIVMFFVTSVFAHRCPECGEESEPQQHCDRCQHYREAGEVFLQQIQKITRNTESGLLQDDETRNIIDSTEMQHLISQLLLPYLRVLTHQGDLEVIPYSSRLQAGIILTGVRRMQSYFNVQLDLSFGRFIIAYATALARNISGSSEQETDWIWVFRETLFWLFMMNTDRIGSRYNEVFDLLSKFLKTGLENLSFENGEQKPGETLNNYETRMQNAARDGTITIARLSSDPSSPVSVSINSATNMVTYIMSRPSLIITTSTDEPMFFRMQSIIAWYNRLLQAFESNNYSALFTLLQRLESVFPDTCAIQSSTHPLSGNSPVTEGVCTDCLSRLSDCGVYLPASLQRNFIAQLTTTGQLDFNTLLGVSLVLESSNIHTLLCLQRPSPISPLKRLGHPLIEEIYKTMKSGFQVFS
ncbi:hypothetical protein [Endozoicomonas montiporae]|uniref:Uncharacterized protein n=1 Tax=Endozoicomonas montiporae CL-33 TaxID=570277 RepID=A0A142BF97_9GAMM|nr:hypothetical protein [Endozoicomonas montiporae]AMO57423.1 hypothetical protein EZMO1_3432 [Endozoicomonas montiporae CL-33]